MLCEGIKFIEKNKPGIEVILNFFLGHSYDMWRDQIYWKKLAGYWGDIEKKIQLQLFKKFDPFTYPSRRVKMKTLMSGSNRVQYPLFIPLAYIQKKNQNKPYIPTDKKTSNKPYSSTDKVQKFSDLDVYVSLL